MTALATLQAGFSGYLLDETGQGAVAPAVRVPAGIDVAARLHVYRNAYVERLRETLQTDYPVLLRLVGAERFAQMAYGYIAAQRSVSPNIRWFGGGFPAAITQDATARAMAQFEWAIGLAFDAADDAAIGAADLSTVAAEAWPALRFSLHPALHVLDLDHAVPDWWLAVNEAEEAADLPAAPQPLSPEQQHWAIWRSETGVRFRMLEPDEAAMLKAVADGEAFAGLCQIAADHGGIDTAAMRAAGLLRQWLDSGWIAGFETAGA
ncbi:MAG: DNA-binding domain-containing protein [Ferrovibrio sp.]